MTDTSFPPPMQAPTWQYTTQPVTADGMLKPFTNVNNTAVNNSRTQTLSKEEPIESESISINVNAGLEYHLSSQKSSMIHARE